MRVSRCLISFDPFSRSIQLTSGLLQGHYIENTSKTETLEWLEYYKSDRVVDISVSQWLALTPPDIAAYVLGVPIGVVKNLKKEKQYLIKAN